MALLALFGGLFRPGAALQRQQEAARYAAQARGNYVPPGPPEDPWGPYIRDAGKRFDVPEMWIRSVMRVEFGGNQYQNGQLITSSAGAMGLMQVMPETYDELRGRYSLGDDPFDPHDNILAGTAYLREMYDIYGSPGFLAAYNAGPRRLDDYLSNNRPLPDETRRYVAMIGPNIVGVYPSSRSPAEDYAMNALPIDIPPGTRYGRATQLASSRGGGGPRADAGPGRGGATSRAAAAGFAAAPQQYALASPPPPPSRGGFRLIHRPWRSRYRCATAARRPASGRSRSAPIPTRAWPTPHSAARASTHRRSWRSRTPRCRACTRGARVTVSRAVDRLSREPRCRPANASRTAARAAWCCRRSCTP